MFWNSIILVLATSFVQIEVANIGKTCGRDEWQCRDGTCIKVYDKCDGRENCPDGSDETYAVCRTPKCDSNLFRCAYGACVDATASCNGFQDCADKSDELQPKCSTDNRIHNAQFTCDNGQNISVTEMCDGEPHCQDESDEKLEACAGMPCDPNLFQCAYGACVNTNSECNGKQDCFDGSDESDELCNRTSTGDDSGVMSRFSSSCKKPSNPLNGNYTVQRIKSGIIVHVSCDTGYTVMGNISRKLPCFTDDDDDDDFNTLPKCTRYCDLPSHPSVTYNCEIPSDNGKLTRSCNAREFVNTTAIPTCKAPNYYGSPGHMHCTDSGWGEIKKCLPECGRVTLMATPTSLGGKRVNHSDVPWHAGIYDKLATPYRQICGGSIVSTTAVITAAHCFWTDHVEPAENYTVAVGKIYRNWMDSHDPHAQYSNIIKILTPETFCGDMINYQSDVAILKLETAIVYQKFIRPVCISFDYNYNNKLLKSKSIGKVAGWGLTENGLSSTVLRRVELPFIPYDDCLREASNEFKQYVSLDKFCAGLKNGITLCEGDSGGGMTFETEELGVQRSYLLGIASTSLRSDNKCNPFVHSIFTNINVYLPFLRDNLEIEGQ